MRVIPDEPLPRPARAGREDTRQNASPSIYSSARYHAWKISALPYLLFVLLPLAAILLGVSIPLIGDQLAQPAVAQAIRLSLSTSLVTVALALLFGTPVAGYLARRPNRFHHLVDTLVDLPVVLPPAVAGVGLLMAFGRRGLVGAWLESLGISLPFSPAAVILAQLFVAGPLYIKSAAQGFRAVDPELHHAAAMDGASRWQIFRYITLPLSWSALISGCVMTWARALGEFGATIIFAGNFPGRTQTMPLAIYLGFELDLRVALVLSVILILSSFLTILLVKAVLHRAINHTLEPL